MQAIVSHGDPKASYKRLDVPVGPSGQLSKAQALRSPVLAPHGLVGDVYMPSTNLSPTYHIAKNID